MNTSPDTKPEEPNQSPSLASVSPDPSLANQSASQVTDGSKNLLSSLKLQQQAQSTKPELSKGPKIKEVGYSRKVKIPQKVQEAPGKALEYHLTISEVRKMIEEATAPLSQLPGIKNELKALANTLRDNQTIAKGIAADVVKVEEAVKEFKTVDKAIKKIQMNATEFRKWTEDTFILQKQEDKRLLQTIDHQNLKIDRVQINIDTKDEYVKARQEEMMKVNAKRELKFDKLYKSVQEMQEQNDRELQELKVKHENAVTTQEAFHEQVMGKLTETIVDIHECNKMSEIRFIGLENGAKDIARFHQKIQKFESVLEGVNSFNNQVSNISAFLSKSLPILIHTQICEALEKVIGNDYRQPLIDFERSKNNELGEYTKGAGPVCIKYMHHRLQKFLDWMVEKDSGCISITWGEDVKHMMHSEEFEHIDVSYEIYVQKRLENMFGIQRDIKEVFKILTKEGPRSDVLIKNKLKNLDNQHAWALKRMLLEHKIMNKQYDDIYESQSKARAGRMIDTSMLEDAIGNENETPSGANSPSRRKGGLYGSPGDRGQFPQKMYVIQREGLRQYAQLDKKIQQLFDGAYDEFQGFKKRQLKNVQLQTKMTVDICNEIKQFKDVFKDFQDQFDQFEESEYEKQQNMRQESKKQFDQLRKQLNECDFAQRKSQVAALQASQKLHEVQEKNHQHFQQNIKRIMALEKKAKRGSFGGKGSKASGDEQASDIEEDENEDDEDSLNSEEDPLEPDSIVDEGVQIKEGDSGQKGISQRQIASKPLDSEGDGPKLQRKMTMKEQQKKKVQDKMNAKKKSEALAAHKRREREEQEQMAQKMREINELEKKREQDEKEEAEAAAAAQKKEQEARALRKSKFKAAANSIIAGNSLLQKIQNQAQKESQKQKQMDFMIAKLKGKVIADKQALQGKMASMLGVKKQSPTSSNIEKQRTQPTDAAQSQIQNRNQSVKVADESSEDDFADQEEYNGPGISQEQLDAQIDMKIKTLKDEFGELVKNGIEGKIMPMKEELVKMAQLLEDSKQEGSKLQDQVMEQIEDVVLQNKQFQGNINYSIKMLEERFKNDESDYCKLRYQVKSTIRGEIEKFQACNDSNQSEFIRLNTLAELNHQMLQLLVDDSMLNQLMLEQDVQDRKQIGLFGLKKNQHIIGTNQGAMGNNLARQGKPKSRSNSGSNLWDLPNKDQKYSEVVTQSELQNSRQKLQNLQKLQTIQEINGGDQSMLFDSSDLKVSDHQPLRVDNNCVSCSGFAPQILSQIKFACLSYVNSPVQFGNENFRNTDLLQVKEMILKRVEGLNKDLAKIQQVSSSYGCINLKTEPDEEKDQIQVRPESILKVTNPENFKMAVQREDSKDQVLNTENEPQMVSRDGSPKSPYAGIGTDNQGSFINSIDGILKPMHSQINSKKRLTDFQIQKKMVELFPQNQPKFQINTLQKLVLFKKDFVYSDKVKPKSPKSSHPKDFDNKDLKENLFKILDLDGLCQNQKNNAEQVPHGASYFSNLKTTKEKLKVKNNFLRQESVMYKNMQSSTVNKEHEQIIHQFHKKSNLHIYGDFGDFMVLGDNQQPPSLAGSGSKDLAVNSRYMSKRNRNAAMDLNTVLNNGSIDDMNQTLMIDSIHQNSKQNQNFPGTQHSLISTIANDFSKTQTRKHINLSQARAKTPQNNGMGFSRSGGYSTTDAGSKQVSRNFKKVQVNNYNNMNMIIQTQKLSVAGTPQHLSSINSQEQAGKGVQSGFNNRRHTVSEVKPWVAVVTNKSKGANNFGENTTISGTGHIMSTTKHSKANSLLSGSQTPGLQKGTLNVMSGK